MVSNHSNCGNHLDTYKDENGSYRLKNSKFYFIKSNEQRDDAGFKNFLSDLQSSAKIDWRNYKNDISIKWYISNYFEYKGIVRWGDEHRAKYLIFLVPDCILVILNQKYGYFEDMIKNKGEFLFVTELKIEHKQNFYSLLKMIDLYPENINFEKFEIIKNNFLANEKINYNTPQENNINSEKINFSRIFYISF